jgi:hypothetical protein
VQLHAEKITVHTRHPFIIARGTSEYHVVWVRVRRAERRRWDGGLGQAAPFYGETADSVMTAMTRFAPVLEQAEAGRRRDRAGTGEGAAVERGGALRQRICDLAAKHWGPL